MFEALGVEFVKSDLTKREGLEALLDGIDGVFHVAGIHDYSTPRELMVAVNVNAVENLCDACVSAGVERFIHLSSAGVYGYDWHDKTPVKEDAPKVTPPLNAYNETKWAGEQVVHRFGSEKGLKVTAIRPGAIYGTRSEYGIHNAVKHVYSERDKARIMMLGSGDHVEGFVHVEDVCRAMIYAFDHDAMIGEAYNVADDSRLTTAEFFNFLSRELFGAEKPFLHVPIQRADSDCRHVAVLCEEDGHEVQARKGHAPLHVVRSHLGQQQDQGRWVRAEAPRCVARHEGHPRLVQGKRLAPRVTAGAAKTHHRYSP